MNIFLCLGEYCRIVDGKTTATYKQAPNETVSIKTLVKSFSGRDYLLDKKEDMIYQNVFWII